LSVPPGAQERSRGDHGHEAGARGHACVHRRAPQLSQGRHDVLESPRDVPGHRRCRAAHPLRRRDVGCHRAPNARVAVPAVTEDGGGGSPRGWGGA
jgi:hypothetical protein